MIDSTDDLPARRAPRPMGAVNWRGVWTLYAKEVQRFLKVPLQTLLAPLMTALLFLAIFSLALGGALRTVAGVPFLEFLAPGLVMMTIVQNAFANTSSSLLIAKVQGNIVDVLMPPLSPAELALGYAGAGTTRGVLVGFVVSMGFLFFVPMTIASLWQVIFFPVAGALMLSLIGLLTGIWAEKFDQMAAITNFVITPLAFLSGTFYSIERLPEFWHGVALANPFFYMIDGFRSGIIGRADGSVMIGALVLVAVDALLLFAAYRCFSKGYKLRN
jgi:ABC-2 type transport system permease protein